MTRQSALLALFLAPAFLFAQTHFYVSPAGNDAWSGTLPEANVGRNDGPFATPERARDAVRTANSFPATVYFRDGVYFVEKPWRFEAKDSGRKSAQISYQNYGDERPIISGGIVIDRWQFEGNLWVTALDDVKNGKIYFKELFVNDERRERARHPNKGQFLHINGTVPENDHNAFYFYPGDVTLFQNLQDVNICLYQSWLAIHLWIDEINLGQNSLIFSPRLWFAAGEFDNHSRYYIENAFEWLDQPGEWYLNRRTGQLYYYPFPGETPQSCTVIAACVDRVLELSGSTTGGAQVEYLNFVGLRFQNADWIVTSADKTEGQAHIQLDDAVIHLKGASNCTIKRCEVTLGGAHGIVLSQGCSNNVVEQCHVHALGGGGIYIGNTSGWNACEEPPLAAQINANAVQNCYIHDLTHVHHGSVGIWIGNSFDNRIQHNEISDLDYTGISVGWCWGYQAATSGNNLIAFNHIHHLGQGELSDMGGIYTLGVAPETHLHHNLIHDIYAYDYGGWGIYPDEGSSELLIEKNIVYNTKSPSFHQHYGQDNVVRNNILAFSETAGLQRTRDEEGKSFTFAKNIVLTQNGEALWGAWTNGDFMMNDNLYWDVHSQERMDFGLASFAEWRTKGFDLGSKIENPLFVDAAGFDFDLDPSSPAYSLGFETIDTQEIGLVGDAAWRDLPSTFAHRPINPIARPAVTTFFNRDELHDTFDDRSVGSVPALAQIDGVAGSAGQSILISNERAASGANSLKFDDRVLQQNTYEPFLYYMPFWYADGIMTVSFDISMQAGSSVTFEYRDELGYPNGVGPSVALAPSQTWKEGAATVKLPTDEWFHVTLSCAIGSLADGLYDVSVTVNGQTVNRLDRKMNNKTWRRAKEVYFISTANSNTAFYIDNLRFALQREETSVDQPVNSQPQMISLSKAYPNPFNPQTCFTIHTIDAGKPVTIELYNLQGRRVRTLFNSTLPAGFHTLTWDGLDDGGLPVASGVYWVQMRIEDASQIGRQKVTLLR